ncbi:HAD family hydrolase [Streptococcus mutans]|uniref:HAD family hydrolase n=1 Tax=Streptococcus mutans TaxID=1309 RepID=UPI001455D4BC|nr:HAD family hydrolase [Streptococcus mutans]MCB4952029.1 HAD family hydrolase [Streptococcus mutans]MCB5024572.1 HAD family hydrolase [Streptococcus mutans]MCB5056726.1 HAD family hydrolase [Streptococcus mutans]MCB5096178.1 HAD family hydrolase [Streptococcus mutans]MDB8636922.1 HAD family hydrolase [Streptococcus mutans]
MYQTILFDLDGTLTNPALGITNSLAYALEKFNIEVTDKKELYRFIGPPLQDSFENFYHFSKEDSLKAVDFYRDYFRHKGLYENEVYQGIPDLLERLKAQGKKLLVATSKPEEFARQILKHFELFDYFDLVAGASMDGSRRLKGDVIAYALTSAQVSDLSATIMIGDREHDIIGAKKNGLDAIGVPYGFGNREELKKAGATYIATNVEELQGRLL